MHKKNRRNAGAGENADPAEELRLERGYSMTQAARERFSVTRTPTTGMKKASVRFR